MEETIKGIEVIAYKGMESDMTCRDFQYEIGKTYKTDKAKLCECGFHACLNPLDVLDYYSKETNSRYFKVKLSGEIAKCDKSNTKVATTEITILEEINIDEVIETIEWWKTENVLDLLYWSEGFEKVRKRDELWNFINKDGKLLFNEWFEFYYVWHFHDGFAKVRRGDYLWNFIDKNGNYLSNEWFNYLGNFHEGFARVQRGNKLYNFIDKQGNYLTDEWFKYLNDFQDGLARVQREDSLYNFIDKNSNYLSNEWFIWVDIFINGFASMLTTNGDWVKIDKTGKLLET